MTTTPAKTNSGSISKTRVHTNPTTQSAIEVLSAQLKELGASVSTTGLTLSRNEYTEQELLKIGSSLLEAHQVLSTALRLAIGDWLNSFEQKLGRSARDSDKSQSLDSLCDRYGMQRKTLQNWASTAKGVKPSLRREGLTWSMYVALAPQSEDNKALLIGQVVNSTKPITTRDFQQRVRALPPNRSADWEAAHQGLDEIWDEIVEGAGKEGIEPDVFIKRAIMTSHAWMKVCEAMGRPFTLEGPPRDFYNALWHPQNGKS